MTQVIIEYFKSFDGVLDTVGPTLSFPRDLPKHTVSRPRFKWTSDEHAERFLCSLDGQSNGEFCGSGKSGGWQRYNVPDGNYQFFVQGIDDLGNKGPEISHFFKVGKWITNFTFSPGIECIGMDLMNFSQLFPLEISTCV